MIKKGCLVDIEFSDGEKMRGAEILYTPSAPGDSYIVKGNDGREHHVMQFVIMSECAAEKQGAPAEQSGEAPRQNVSGSMPCSCQVAPSNYLNMITLSVDVDCPYHGQWHEHSTRT